MDGVKRGTRSRTRNSRGNIHPPSPIRRKQRGVRGFQISMQRRGQTARSLVSGGMQKGIVYITNNIIQHANRGDANRRCDSAGSCSGPGEMRSSCFALDRVAWAKRKWGTWTVTHIKRKIPHKGKRKCMRIIVRVIQATASPGNPVHAN